MRPYLFQYTVTLCHKELAHSFALCACISEVLQILIICYPETTFTFLTLNMTN